MKFESFVYFNVSLFSQTYLIINLTTNVHQLQMGPCNSKSKNIDKNDENKNIDIDIISGKDMTKIKTSNFLMEFDKDIVFIIIKLRMLFEEIRKRKLT